ncbi:hypothetical protein COSO111634_31785 [Corallococcus soli]
MRASRAGRSWRASSGGTTTEAPADQAVNSSCQAVSESSDANCNVTASSLDERWRVHATTEDSVRCATTMPGVPGAWRR